MQFKLIWKSIKHAFVALFEHKIMKLSAALAYYTVFSLPGLIIIIVWVIDIFYGGEAVQGTVYGQIATLVGSEAATQIQETIRNGCGTPEAIRPL